MKSKILFFTAIGFLCFFCKTSIAQTPDWLWAKCVNGTGSDYVNSVMVDASGNTYVAGGFKSSAITFGSSKLTNASEGIFAEEIFFAKYDANGNELWAKSAGGKELDEATSLAKDASGNIYMAGYYVSSSITIGSTTLTNSSTNADIFLTKYDANGNLLWVKSAGGIKADWTSSLAVDPSGNIYLTGTFCSPTFKLGSTILTNSDTGSTDIYLAKYDTNGNILWAKSAGGTDWDWSNSLAIDASGNTYIAGYFSGSTLTFGSTTLNNTGSRDICLAKYDVNGNVLWAKTAIGTGEEEAISVVADASGNIYMTGYYSSTTLSFGSTTLTNANNSGHSYDIFLSKYDASGNVLWAKSAGGTNFDNPRSIIVDASGNPYVAGSYKSPALTFGSTTLNNKSTNDNDDIFLVKYDINGNVLWATSAGEENYDKANSIAIDTTGNIYLAGNFSSKKIIIGTTTLMNKNTGPCIFVAKLLNNMGKNK